MDNSLRSVLVLVVAIVIAAAFPLFFRFVVKVVSRIFRGIGAVVGVIARPLQRSLSKVFRFLRLGSGLKPASKPLRSLVGSGVESAAQFLGETDKIIAEHFVPGAFHMHRHGKLFQWLHPQTDHTPEYDRARAAQDYEKAEAFFKSSISSSSNPLNLYDDIEGAFFVQLLRDSDMLCFYVLAEFKKTINANVIKMAVLYSVIVSLALTVLILFSGSLYFPTIAHLVRGDFQIGGLSIPLEAFVNQSIFGGIVCIIAWATMGLFHQAAYKHFQRHNGQQLNNFLNLYLADINGNYAKIQTSATQAVVEEKDIKEVKVDIVLWVTNLQWMALRAFFIECYLRVTLFQIYRNSTYCTIFVPVLFAALSLGAYLLGVAPTRTSNSSWTDVLPNLGIIIFSLALVFAYYGRLRRALLEVTESIEGQWYKFKDLNLLNAMTKIMESYAAQLDQWRSRFRGREGSPAGG